MDKPKPTFEEIKHMTPEEQRAHFLTCSKTELLDLLNVGLKDLLQQIERIPELIYDGLEKKLESDVASRQATDELMARLRSQPKPKDN